MNELEWLKQESGMSDEEMKAMEAVAGHTKFVSMLQKMIATNEQSTTAQRTAEAERLALEKRYNDEFIPEMRKVTQDSLRAQGEAAAAQAALKAAREYGIVPEETKTPETPRAPGSPDPNALTRADLERLSGAQSRAIITLNDLNAEHYKLFGAPLGNSQELVDEVQRQRTLGHNDYSLRKAWETKYEVDKKRTEVATVDAKKHDDEVIAAALKEDRQKRGDNPNVRSGQPSRFSTYKQSDAAGNQNKPWLVPAGQKKAALQPWREAAVKKLREVAG